MTAITLLVEPFGGAAGDMLLAALCDLGDPRFGLAELRALAERLVPGEARLTLTEVRRGELRALHLAVATPETAHPPHRHLADLLELVERAALPSRARERAARVLERIARAEGRVHGIDPEEVHFHEVGAVDTLVDVCGFALALDALGVERVAATPPLLGEGTVRCAHGEMPVPAPGTAELLVGVPVRAGGGGGERTTPTGAALLAELCDFEPLDGFRAERAGYGAGTRDPRDGPPNALRVQLGATSSHGGPGVAGLAGAVVLEFEFQVDDATGEELGFALERLRALGALDVWTAAVSMKKGRPGVLVAGLARPERRAELERAAFDHTSTFGVRWSERRRTECAREWVEVELEGRAVRVKRRRRPHAPDALSRADLAPEHDDLAALAEATGLPLRELRARAVELALARLGA